MKDYMEFLFSAVIMALMVMAPMVAFVKINLLRRLGDWMDRLEEGGQQ